LECFHNDTLTRETGISVDLDGHDLLAVDALSTKEVLFGACAPRNDGVDSLEMGGVREHGQFDLFVCFAVFANQSGSQMIFGVTGSLEATGELLVGFNSLELSHDDILGFLEDVGKCLQTTSMRHANHKSLSSVVDTDIDREFKSGNECLEAFDAESFGGVELLGHEVAPCLCPVESAVHVQFFLFGKGLILNSLEFLSDPGLHVAVRDMGELDTDLRAVSIVQGGDQFTQFPVLLPGEDSPHEREIDMVGGIEVCFAEPVRLVVESLFEALAREVELLLQRCVA
jgi:hypothetical protein